MSKASKLVSLLEDISATKQATILNLDTLTDKTVQLDRLRVRCNHCQVIKEPTIHDFRKKPEQTCRCQVKKTKLETLVKTPFQEEDIWRPIHALSGPLSEKYGISAFATYYQVSRDGEVRNALTESMLKSHLSGGYPRLNLRRASGEGYKSIFVHVLVACAFLPFPDLPLDDLEKLIIDHIDQNKENNTATNLRWVIPSQQVEHHTNSDQLGVAGKMWVDNIGVYFSLEDFDTACPDKSAAKCFEYLNACERAAINDSLEFPGETWKRILYNEKRYFVSTQGRIYNEGTKKASFGIKSENGYMKFDSHRVHRIAALAFLQQELEDKIASSGKKVDDLIVNHIDGRKCNNTITNLEWVTASENIQHAGVKKCAPVLQLLDGKIIGRFESISQAESAVGNPGGIWRCVKENSNSPQSHTSAGFVWIEASTVPLTPKEIKGSEDELLDLSRHISSGQIKISQKDFTRYSSHPQVVPSIMHLLESFDKPILPFIPSIDPHFDKLLSDDTKIIEGEDGELSVSTNNQGRPLLNHFMYEVMIKGRPKGKPSYETVWYDLALREKMVRRMLDKDVRMNNGSLFGCYGCQYGRLYNFPSNVARCLYDNFKAKRVLDFCAGYGGRLLGFWASEAEEYVGIDPNKDIPYNRVLELLRTFKEKKARIITACAEDVDYSELGRFDMIFTSPPYFDTELYSEDETQSCKRYPSVSKWLDKFLYATLDKAVQVLLPGGTLAINIKDPKGKNKIVEPMLEHLRGMDLEEGTPIKLLHAKRHLKNAQYEYIYVFKKRRIIPKRFKPLASTT